MQRVPALLMAGGSLLAAMPATAAEVPLPPPRPAITAVAPGPPLPAPRPAAIERRRPAVEGPAPAAPGAPCTALLADGIAEIELNASISGLSGDDLCGDEAPVRISAVRLREGGRVELRPAAMARCGMAHAFARWVRDDLAAAASLAGRGLTRIDIAASYHCRPRNNVTGARLSEHGRANAIDVRAVHLGDGRRIAIEDTSAAPLLLSEMRRTACARFTTVLGPGADAAHADHLHLDLAERRGGFRLCQWSHAEGEPP